MHKAYIESSISYYIRREAYWRGFFAGTIIGGITASVAITILILWGSVLNANL